MIMNFYSASWHRYHLDDRGYHQSNLMEDCYINSFSKEEAISEAKKLLGPYLDNEKYHELCSENDATDVDISVDLFVIDTDASNEKLTIDNVDFFDPEYYDNVCLVRIENGEIVVNY